MKKVISLLLVLILTLGVCHVLAEEGYAYENGVLYFTGTGEAALPKFDIPFGEMTKVVIGKDITNVDYIVSAFTGNTAYYYVEEIQVDEENPYFSSLDGVLFNKDKTTLLRFPPYKKGGYVVPESVKEIRENAFYLTLNLESVLINGSVTEIKRGTFGQCRSLRGIAIPKSVVKIEEGAFSGGDTNITGQHHTALSEIYYNGTYADWAKIEKGASYNYHRMNITVGGDILKRATKYFTDTYITVGQAKINLTAPLYSNYDRVTVSVRDVFEKIGYTVTWLNEDRSVYVNDSRNNITFPVFESNNVKGEVCDAYINKTEGVSVVTQNSYPLQSLNGGLYNEDIYHHVVLHNGKAMISTLLLEKLLDCKITFQSMEERDLKEFEKGAKYVDKYDDCTVAVFEDSVFAWGEAYGDIPVKLLDNIKELKAIRRSFNSYSYYAICEDNSLYVWGAHGSYTNMLPSLKPAKYTYVGGMLGLPCNTNVKPRFDGPSEWIDWSKYNDASPDQKKPVKLLDNVKKVVVGDGKVVTLGVNGEVYIWGEYSGANRSGDYAPKLINSNAEEIYVTGTSPALSNGKIGILEKGGSFAVYSGSTVQERIENVEKVYVSMLIASFTPVFTVLTTEGELWEITSYKTLLMDNVADVELKNGVTTVLKFDGTIEYHQGLIK